MLQGIISGNIDKRQFSLLEKQRLGNYIYALKDPRDRKIFYVGQGVNNRVFDHFSEADNHLRSATTIPSSKIMRILDIWASDEDVEWLILSSGHDSTNKLILNSIESAVIDTLSESQNGPALNAVSGPNSTFLSKEDLIQINSKPIDPIEQYQTVFVFPIHGALANGENIYNATRMTWAVKDFYRDMKDAVAVGIKEFISLGSYRIEKWQNHDDKKYEFIGTEFPEFKNMNWRRIISDAMGYWQRGNYLVIEFDGKGKFRNLKGNSDKSWRSIRLSENAE